MKRTVFFLVVMLVVLSCGGVIVYNRIKKNVATPYVPDEVERLRSLAYLDWSPVQEEDKSKQGVVIHDEQRCFPGFNLYAAREAAEARLLDMDGEVVHVWEYGSDPWYIVQLGANGNLFFIGEDKRLVKLDWDSNVVWATEAPFHHWISISEDGDIYTLTRDIEKIDSQGQVAPILNDYITIVSSQGKIKKKISLYTLFKHLISAEQLDVLARLAQVTGVDLPRERNTPFDIFHANAASVIERDIDGVCRKGDVLLSMRELDMIAVVDPVAEKVRWSWGRGELDGQHAPLLLDNGNILIFDNGRARREYSRVVEFDPRAKKIVGEYTLQPPTSFYTASRGYAQRFPNGNVLMTEADQGRVVEIDPKGSVVWEFYNPTINNEGEREIIYRMQRISPDRFPHLLLEVTDK